MANKSKKGAKKGGLKNLSKSDRKKMVGVLTSMKGMLTEMAKKIIPKGHIEKVRSDLKDRAKKLGYKYESKFVGAVLEGWQMREVIENHKEDFKDCPAFKRELEAILIVLSEEK